MAKTRAPFKQIDVTRAVKGAVAAGLAVVRIDVDRHTGKISIWSADSDVVTDESSVIDKMLGIK